MNLLSDLREQVSDLDQRIAALQADAKPIREQLGNLDRQAAKLSNERAALLQRVNELSAKPRVSDHAVIRYLERKHGFSFEKVREELLSPTVIQAMDMGADGVRMNGGVLKLKGRTIVTYVEAR